MRLITNKDNSSALKVLIAGEFSNTSIDFLIVEKPVTDNGLKRLPLLEVSKDLGDIVYSTNAASNMIFPTLDNNQAAVDDWLDWEATYLQPSVLQCVDAKGSITEPLISHLALVNNALRKSKYLVKNAVTAADISLWSTLFPLFSEKTLKTHVQPFTKLVEWFSELEKLPEFQSALKKLNPAGGMASLNSILSATWYPAKQTSSVTAIEDQNCEPAIEDSEIQIVKKTWTENGKNRPKPKPPVNPTLPKPGERNILITSALPYVNNVPHLGNIIGCVLSADVFARFCRLRNWNTLYISGTDEYGTATEAKALEENLSPLQICDKYHAIHKQIYSWFNIEFDLFGRTSSSQQTEVVQDLFTRCHAKGYTLSQFMDQLLCTKCDKFLADRFVEGVCPKCKFEDARGDQCDACGQLINAVELIKPRCKTCGSTPVIKQSQQLFLNLPKISERLQKWVNDTSHGWTQNSEVITKSWLREGLKPRCITRDLKWGIPVPLQGFEKKVFYVWFDAPIGYISMTKCYTPRWKQWWQPESNTKVELFQFMAKDNVPFHSIMFPATLMAVNDGFTIVNHVFATEYLNYEDGKFSKSRGVGVFGTDARETGIPADVFRFYLLYMRPEGQDTCFSWVDLATKNNSELLNNLGNFVNRALMFCEKFYDRVIPEMVMTQEDWEFLARVLREVKAYNQVMECSKFREGIVRILNVSRLGNQYLQVCEPWQAIKGSEKDKERAKTCIGISCNMVVLLSILLKPYMPNTADIIASQINSPKDIFVLTESIYQVLQPGHKIGKPSPLFAKIEPTTVEQLKKRFSGRQQTPTKTSSLSHAEIDTVDKMEAAVKKQADLVRGMKEGGAAKSEWQPHVQVLLDMKKQLETMKLSNSAGPAASSSTGSSSSVADVEKEVAAQGEKVRKLKQEGKPKSEWQPEVEKLLNLKKELAKLKGEPDPTIKQKGNKK